MSVSSAEAARRTLRVGFFASEGVNQKAEDGTLSGYEYDFFERLSKYADWEIQYVGYERDWSEMLPMLERGEIDVVGCVTDSPERHEKFALSRRPMAYTCTSIRTTPDRLETYRLPGTGTWPRARVGHLAADLSAAKFAEFAEDHSFSYEMKDYPNERAAAEACKRGELELVAFDAFAPYWGLVSVSEIQHVRNHLAVRKDDTALLAEIDAAMDRLCQAEPSWMSEVRGAYYPQKEVTAYFPSYFEPPMRRYHESLLTKLAEVCGWKVTIRDCNDDFSDADLSGDALGCGLYFAMPCSSRFEMPLYSAGRRRADLFARPDDVRFTNALPVVSSSYRIGYVRKEKLAPKFLQNFATEKGVSYQLIPFASRAELHQRLADGDVDLIVCPSTHDIRLRRVAACGYGEFYLAPGVGQASFANAVSDALKFLRLDDPSYFLRLEHDCFDTGDDDRRHVRVAAYVERGLSARDENGDWSGVVPDLVRRIEVHCGWNVSYFSMTYPEAQRALADGTVDLIGYMTRTPEREKLYDFSRFTLGPLVYSLMTPAGSRMKANDPDSWAGARIGVMRGSKSSLSLARFLADRGVSWQARYYNDIVDSEAALHRGELDATLTLASSGNRDLVSLAEVPTDLCYFSTARAKPWVLEELDAAIGDLLREDEDWISTTSARHLRKDRNVLLFSNPELEYIRSMADRPITVTFDAEQAPLVVVDSVTGEVSGFYRRLFDRYSSASGLRFVLLPPGSPSDIEVCVCGCGHEADPSRIIDACWLKSSACWVKHRSSSEGLPRGVVAVVKGDRQAVEFVRQLNLRVLPCRSREGAYEAVRDGRADSYVANYAVARYYIDELKMYPELSIQRINNDTFYRSIAVKTSSSADSRLRSILGKLRDTMSEGDFDTLVFESIYGIRPTTVRVITVVLLIVGVLVVACLVIAWVARLAHLAHSMNTAKTLFLNSMSHDIRTPMNAIVGFSAIARRNIDDPVKVEECLGKIDVAGNHLLQLVNEVLDVSRIESGTVQIREAPFDIVAYLDSLKTLFATTAAHKGLEFSVDSSMVRHRWVRCDSARIDQVVLNVVGNAVKYTNQGSVKIVVRETPLSESEGRYVMAVTDTGVGMSAAFLRKIYDPFAREQSAAAAGIQGTGLGMSIVKKIIDLCRGDIEVVSEPGRGTSVTMCITLPYGEPPADAKPEEPPPADVLENRRALLVEDNALNREIARFMIEGMGVIVDECVNGAAAVERLRQNAPDHYDWVLMDIQMPVMNGYEATREIRRFNPTIPIIAMTANAFAEDRAAAFKAGMDDHITKPVKEHVIKAALLKFV